MKKIIIKSELAPKAVGPYSIATSTCHLLFTAGQIPLDPQTGKLVEGTIEAQTRRAITNLKIVLEAGGSDLDHVMKTTVFLQNMSDFAAMNAVYAEFFTQDHPARSAVEVAALPLHALVEIEAIALIPGDD